MTTVSTVSGEVGTDALGVTYMHEHIFCVDPQMQRCWPGYRGWDEDAEVEKARRALILARDAYGVQTMVDVTVAGLGRDIRAVARAVEGTGVNLIAATGWYTYRELPLSLRSPDVEAKAALLLDLFLRDIRDGLEGTAIKPGIIKCATDVHGVTPDIESLLRASARACLETGVPITTHSEASNESGLDQQRIFREEGVDFARVIIGHCNQAHDLGYLERLIEGGSLIGWDRCGLDNPGPSLDVQIDNLAELCRRGYADRIVLSHDTCIFVDLLEPGEIDTRRPNHPWGYIHHAVLPGLRQRGVTDEQIQLMLVANPSAYFSA